MGAFLANHLLVITNFLYTLKCVEWKMCRVAKRSLEIASLRGGSARNDQGGHAALAMVHPLSSRGAARTSLVIARSEQTPLSSRGASEASDDAIPRDCFAGICPLAMTKKVIVREGVSPPVAISRDCFVPLCTLRCVERVFAMTDELLYAHKCRLSE